MVDHWANYVWHSDPLGSEPQADTARYNKLALEVRKKVHPEVDRFESESGFSIDPDWFHDLALLTQITIKRSGLCYQHGRLLYSAMRRYLSDRNPEWINVLETGTARGFSALCMARALGDAEAPGKIVTLDVLPNETRMYWNCVGDEQGRQTRLELLAAYRELLDRYVVFVQGDTRLALPKVSLSRIHFAFLDAAHTYTDVMAEAEHIQGKQLPGDVLFFDDYTQETFPGVVQAVDEIRRRYQYDPEVIPASEARTCVMATKC